MNAEAYIVSARKYRPAVFEDVVGQEHITNTLRNGILHHQLGHAFLFCGPRGVGKTTCARILAKAVNCLKLTPSGDPCNSCDSCRGFNEGHSINIFELDAASNNSVEDIRQLIEQMRYVPPNGQKSVYIIDEAHMLSAQAFNAFLKTLEEPPPHAIFILATTEKHKILPTILSRCQKYDFRRIKVEEIMEALRLISTKEAIQYDEDALRLVAVKADGGMRDALSIFDQLVSFSNRNLTYGVALENLNALDSEWFFALLGHVKQQDYAAALLRFNELMERGFDVAACITGLCEHLRNLMLAKEARTVELLEVSAQTRQKYLDQSAQFTASWLLNGLNMAAETEATLRTSSNLRLQAELLLLKLAHLETALELAVGEKKK